MPIFTMDVPKEGKVFDKIAPGRYVVKAIKWEDKLSKSGKVHYIRWTLKITGEDRWNGRQIFMSSFYKGANTAQFYKLLKDINQDHTGSAFNPDDFLEKPFEVEIDYPLDKSTNQPSKYIEVIKTFPFVSDLGSDFDDLK